MKQGMDMVVGQIDPQLMIEVRIKTPQLLLHEDTHTSSGTETLS